MRSPLVKLRLSLRDQVPKKETKGTQYDTDLGEQNYIIKFHIYVPNEFEYDEKKHQLGILTSYCNWDQNELIQLNLERKVEEGYIFTCKVAIDKNEAQDKENQIEYKYVIRKSENGESRIYYEQLPGGDPSKNRILKLSGDKMEFDVHDGRLLMEKDFPNGWIWWTHQVGRGFQEFGVNTSKFFTEDLPRGFDEFGANTIKFFTEDLPRGFDEFGKNLGKFFSGNKQ